MDTKEITAKLRYLRVSPRKVRVVANSIKGRTAKEAEAHLRFLNRGSAPALRKLLRSAMANAKHNFNIDAEKLNVKTVRVDKGPTLKRMKPRSRGIGSPIHKHSSHITLILTEQ